MPDDETIPEPATRTDPGGAAPAVGPGSELVSELVSFADRYRLDHELARGGMGRVLVAHDRKIGREVAIKELLRKTSAAAVARFWRESVMTARLQHPGIIPVYEVDRRADGEPFITMRRVHGSPLSALIREARTPEERLRLLPNVLAAVDALAYAHEHRVIHRDVKPANILVGKFGETVVIDWGLARQLDSAEITEPGEPEAPGTAASPDLTQGHVIGTPAFMAPEQARGEPADERTDVYALGAVLYTLLGGATPYRGATTEEVVRRTASEDPVPLEQLAPWAPPDLVSIVRTAMARDASRRFPSARELAAELRSFQAGQLVSSHRYSPRELVARFVRRHRLPLLVAAAFLIVLAAVATVSLRDVLQERTIAQRALAEARLSGQYLRLGQARALLATNPTGALDAISALEPGLPGWGEARLIAAEALSLGVPQRRYRGPHGPLANLHFEPDSQLLAMAGPKGAIVLDLRTGEARTFGKTRSADARLSPDGHVLASGNPDGAIELITVATGAQRTLQVTDGPLRRVSFVSNEVLAAWDAAGSLFILHVAEGKVERPCHTDALRWLPHLERASVGLGAAKRVADETLCVWTLSDGQTRMVKLPPRTSGSAIARLALKVTAVGKDGGLSLLDVLAGTTRVLEPNTRYAGATPSDDGKLVVAWTHEGGLHIYDDQGRRVRELVAAPGSRVRGFSPRNAELMTLDENVALVWDVATGRQRRFVGPKSIISDAFLRDASGIVTGDADGTLAVWPLDWTEDDAAADVRVLRYLADGTLLTGGADGLQLWSEGAGRLGGEPARAVPGGEPQARALEGAGAVVAAGFGSGAVMAIDRGVARRLGAQRGAIVALAVSSDGKIAAADDSGAVGLYDAAALAAGPAAAATNSAASAIGAPTAAGSASAIGAATATATGAATALRKAGPPASSLVFCNGAFVGVFANQVVRLPDGAVLRDKLVRPGRLACSPDGQKLAVLEGADAQLIGGPRLRGHADDLNWLDFSADSRTLATASADGTIRLWPVAGGAPRILSDHSDSVTQVRFVGATRLISTSHDGTTRVWDLETGRSRAVLDHQHFVQAVVSPDGTRIAAAIHKGSRVYFARDDLPEDPAELLRACHERAPAGPLFP